MLTSTFLHLPSAGPMFERSMWNQGINDWWNFLDQKKIHGVSCRRKIWYDMAIRKAADALDAGNATFFSTLLPPSSMWRLWPSFQDQAVFLDIETTGYYGDVTVVGLFGEDGVQTFVRGRNMDKEALLNALSHYKIILTFNGSSFDLPVLSRYFNITFTQPHIDLRGVCNHLDLRGGLKKIEQTIGLKRPDAVEGMDGYHAVLLWEEFRKTGDEKFLEQLVEYNTQDIVNLKPLAEYAIPRIWKLVRSAHLQDYPRSPQYWRGKKIHHKG